MLYLLRKLVIEGDIDSQQEYTKFIHSLLRELEMKGGEWKA